MGRQNRSRPVLAAIALGLVLLAACSGEATTATTTPATAATTDAARPFEVLVPPSYEAGRPTALLIVLHGFGMDGASQIGVMGMESAAAEQGMLLVSPDGTESAVGARYWNATDACCGFGSTVDDVEYLTSIIDSVSVGYTVDPKRVYLVGFSNGGFMSYRMACERADRIAAIVSLAGAAVADAADCSPSEPVSVLQVHGTADEIIRYEGGTFGEQANRYPGARQTVETWADYNRCTATAAQTGGPATTEAFDGCPTGIGVKLWTLNGVPHWLWTESTPPGQPDAITSAILEFLAAHPKP